MPTTESHTTVCETAPDSRGAEASVRQRLRKVETELTAISTSTEGVFLLAGERLIELQKQAHEISEHTASISQLLTNDAGSLAILDGLLTSTRKGYQGDEIAAVIGDIQDHARAVHRNIQAIGPIVDTFYALGVMTRIESSRCEDAGAAFTDLADAVTDLSRRIRQQVGATDESATTLVESVSQVADEVHRVARQHEESLAPLARQASRELQIIKEHRAEVSEAADRLAKRFGDISRAVGDVVAALQFHDIVRQQVAHVTEALEHAESHGGGCSLADIARVQAAQLDHSRVTFARSVRQVRGSLTEIQRSVGAVAEEAAGLLSAPGASSKPHGSFLSEVEATLAGILSILDANRNADRRLAATAASVDECVTEISRTVTGVHAIGVHMQHIALNATLQAAQLGPDGAALRIVAQTIRELAQKAENTYEMLGRRLNVMRDTAATLGKATAERGAMESQIERIRECIDALDSVQQRAQTDYARTVELTAALKQKTRATVDAFGTQQECLRVLESSTESLRKLAGSDPAADAALLRRMASRYTMQSERAVHETAFDDVARNATVLAGVAATGQDDNVEFF